MAILESLLGVEVTIWCEGLQLAEYDDHEDGVRQKWKHKTVSKYVQSETDAEFFFRFKVGKPYEHDCDELGFAIVLDGCEENIDSNLCGRHTLEDDGEWEMDVHGIETHDADGAKLANFKFSKVSTTDGETRSLTKEEILNLQMIGQIEVRVHQLSHCRRLQLKPKQLRGSLDIIPEKVFGSQAISHSISYEAAEALSTPSVYQGTKYMHGWDGPVGIFRFKYRSRENLQKELIIPRTPSPEPPGPPRAAELTSEQKVRLAHMRCDDIEMLRSLISASTNAEGHPRTSQRTFEDLSPEEIDLFALQKHAEMTGVPIIKAEPHTIIKQEHGAGNIAAPISSTRHRRVFPMTHMGNGKRAVDLTIDDEDDELKPPFGTPQSNSRSKSTPISTPQNPPPSSVRKGPKVDPEKLKFHTSQRGKRRKTAFIRRPRVAKRHC